MRSRGKRRIHEEDQAGARQGLLELQLCFCRAFFLVVRPHASFLPRSCTASLECSTKSTLKNIKIHEGQCARIRGRLQKALDENAALKAAAAKKDVELAQTKRTERANRSRDREMPASSSSRRDSSVRAPFPSFRLLHHFNHLQNAQLETPGGCPRLCTFTLLHTFLHHHLARA